MKQKGRDFRPNLKPVTRIELTETNTKLRWALIVVLLAVAVVAIGTGLMSLLNTQPSWQTVEVTASGPNCGGDFKFLYDFSDCGSSATAKNKELTGLYSEAAQNAYRLFSPEVLEEGLQNVAYLNAHVNEAVTVDPGLYPALELLAAYDDRHCFLAPAGAEYDRVFLCENDAEAALYDPARNPGTAQWLRELAAYARDPEQIRLEILGQNRVRLLVSEEDLAFAEENEIGTFLDFGWMKNAFIADYLARVLTEKGFTHGYLVSYDGFTRNLDERGGEYTFNLFNRQGTEVDLPARMCYNAPASLVFLRDYPMAEEDRWHYYTFASGQIVTAFLDPEDGQSKSALSNLVAYADGLGCGEILLRTAPVFIADTLDTAPLEALAREGLFAVWFEGDTLMHTDPGLVLETPSGGE